MAPSKLDSATMVTRPDRRSDPHPSPWTRGHRSGRGCSRRHRSNAEGARCARDVSVLGFRGSFTTRLGTRRPALQASPSCSGLPSVMAPSKLDPATMVTRPDRRSYPHRSPWTHPRDPACPRSRPRRNLIPRQWSLDRIAGRIRIHHLGLEAIALVGAALVDNRPTPKGRDERAMSASWASEEASPLVSVRVALRFRLHPRDTACRRP